MITAIADQDFELYGVNATTAPVYPAFIVNGPVRHELDIASSYGCFGGAAGPAVAIGRAIRLIMRNVAGQARGLHIANDFRIARPCCRDRRRRMEEKSPWAPLGERRGVRGNAVTSFGTMGTINVIDSTSHAASDFLEMIGKSMAYPGCNVFPALCRSAK